MAMFETPTVFHATAEGVPAPVLDEVKQMWRDNQLGNDYYYYEWSSYNDGRMYPKIDGFLSAHDIHECLIHWWW